MNNERSLAEEITEGFKAMEQLGLAESIIKQQKLEIDALLRFIDERGETGQLIIWKAEQK
jgi:hypothetical protein